MDKQTLKFAARVMENLPEMSPDIMQGWIENPKGLKKFLSDLAPEAGSQTVTQFFQTRSGLWVSSNFNRRVLLKASVGLAAETRFFDLPRYMRDSEIEAKLGEGHIWSEGALCATLQKLIDEQWGGRGGKLWNNGFANLFYTGSYVVRVSWDADRRRWDVHAWQRGYHMRRTSDRAFSPASSK